MNFSRFISLVLVFALILSFFAPASAQTNTRNDISGHWAAGELTKWISKGILQGYPDGTIRPDKSITRAEFVMLLDRIFKFVDKANLSFADVSTNSWYADAVAKATAVGAIIGDTNGKFRPNDPISRTEAAVILSRIFNLEATNESVLDKFSDSDKIPSWGKEALSAMIEKGYMKGRSGNVIAPNSPLTRAEFVKLIDKIVGELVTTEGTRTGNVAGNLVVNTKNVTLKNMVIDGDLYLTQGVAEGAVQLENVVVKGRTIIKGGGEIVIDNSSIADKLFVEKMKGNKRIIASGSTEIKSVELGCAATLQEDKISGKGIQTVRVLPTVSSMQEINLHGDFELISLEAANAKVNITKGLIKTFEVKSTATNSSIQVGNEAKIEKLTVNAKVEVKGQGVIQNAKINVSGVTMERKPANVETAPGVTLNVVSKEEADKKTSGNTGESISQGPAIITLPVTTPVLTSPQAPTGLNIKSISTNSIELNWLPVNGASYYNVYRAFSSAGPYKKINTTAIQSTTYTDTNLIAGTAYYYKVSAVNEYGESKLSEAVVATTQTAPEGWKLVWSDEFNATPAPGVDENKWTYEIGGGGWGNNELQYYTNSIKNVYIEQDPDNPNNGFLVIKAIKEDYKGYHYTSGRIKTAGKFEFTYGRVEMRAKLPYGQGIWPAFWMLGSNINTVGWPNCGEIDIMEFVGKTPTRIYGTIHGPGYSGDNSIGAWHEYPKGFTDDFHTYAIEWEPNVIRWYFDGELYQVRTVSDLVGKTWVFDHDFYIILNLAIGGNWPGSPDASTVFPQKFVIDYVRVFQRESGEYPAAQYRNLIQIKSIGNGKFVCADKYNGDYLYANRSSAGRWEMFELKDLGNGKVALISLLNYKYVSVYGENNSLIPNKESVGLSETFHVVDNGDGTKSLKSMINGKYVTIASNSLLTATAETIGENEKFTFIDCSPPSSPAEVNATSTSNYSVSLSWSPVERATGYNIYRSENSSGPYTKVNATAITSTTYTDSDVDAGKTYYYKVSAVNEYGESALSQAVSATTPVMTTVPAPPTGLMMVSSTEDSIELSWMPVKGALYYNIYRSATSNGPFEKINQEGIQNTSYKDTNLNPGSVYYYKVSAVNSIGESELSEALFATTTGYGIVTSGTTTKYYSYIIALANSKIVHADSTSTPLTASANEATTDSELFEIIFKSDGGVGFASKSLNKLVCADTLNNNNYKLIPRTNYSTTPGGWETFFIEPQGDGTVAIKANNGGKYVTVDPVTGILAATSSTVGKNEKFIIVTPQAAGAPGNLTITKTLYNSVSLSWTAPLASVITGYNVYRSTTSGGPYTKVNDTLLTSHSYTDTKVSAGTTYYYVVAAVNARGEAYSNEVTTTTLNGPLAAVPTGLDIVSSTANSITLTWNEALGAEGYNIYRSTSRFGKYVKINSTPILSTTYTDENLDRTSYYYRVTAVNENGETDLSEPISLEMKLFGPNVYIFDPADDISLVQKVCSDIFAQMERAHFSSDGNGLFNNRYALLFKPGTYNISLKVGFYTQVAGLGRLPDDTTIQSMTVDAKWKPNNNATQNFWRSAENLAVNSNTMWAVSQAAPLRRVHIRGNLTLHDSGGWSSGGFLADSKIDGTVYSGSQQQWFSRNDTWGSWNGQVWNMVFVGVDNPPAGTWPATKYTTVDQTPIVREKPFLYIDESGNYFVFVPDLKTNSKGISWSNGMGAGRSIPLSEFYVARPETDTAATINAALEQGKHLLLTPGIYHLTEPIHVTKPNTVVLGLGFATVVSDNGVTPMLIDDVDGVIVAGIIFDAGPVESKALLQIGTAGSSADHSANPVCISDVFFRVGGPHLGKTEACLVINSNNVIGDDLWIWRADHGYGVGWDQNTAKNGLIVNGNDVTMYGLMVEHFQEYQTLWNGNGGRTYFYQSEIPYDVPYQESWMSNNGTVKGYASYKVADMVTSHEAWGLGIYSYFRDADVDLDRAIEVPNHPNVKIHNACTVMLAGYPGILHVINNTGDPVMVAGQRAEVTEYCNNVDQPVIVPSTGYYETPQVVTITCPTEGATIIYTLDGSTPSRTNGIVYTGPFTVPLGITTIKAMAYKDGMNDSYIAISTLYIGVLSLNKPATASSVATNNPGNTPDKAVDGNLNTRWESAYSDPQWITIDLGTVCSINTIEITWYSANSYAKDFKIQVSNDNSTWTDVYSVTNLTLSSPYISKINFSSPVTGRYVRMYGTRRSASYGYSIKEFVVFGTVAEQ
ncbi:glycoside hydrolase family 16 [Caldicellulosiruptor kronotskyensis 2002]|uniref:Glycoside hydrolase family 16 n=1 Tax=Caldicellulosiruptor kronotskyensis (strain DSM 18902 / VKM B-2412 / 2002) TaxID=632348 RepID=E4SCQ4_CALK2|nr:S-layer homology domain-containing protein [Caldicellulosiruptor kronotskyensis]ADQ45037.1 glycoside hydrolase family 16 [Caldicellulosiruptor kronotskyensis 2002]